MIPNNVHTVCLSGLNESTNNILFQCALYWAELGETVWFISPTLIESLPSCWKQQPDKEILKLIYFIYLSNTRELLIKLSEVHLVPKLPKLIIVKDYDYYNPLNYDEKYFNLHNFALTTACLLDAASAFVQKFKSPSFVCVNIKNPDRKKSLENILDLYFSEQLNIKTDKDFLNVIVDVFKKLNTIK